MKKRNKVKVTRTNTWAMIKWLRAGLLLQALLADSSHEDCELLTTAQKFGILDTRADRDIECGVCIECPK